MGPLAAPRRFLGQPRTWTPARWLDAGAWAALALGMALVVPDSVPAVLCMIAVAATYRLLPDYAFAGVIAVGALVAGQTRDLEWTFGMVIAAGCYLARRRAGDWWWLLAPFAAVLAVVVSEWTNGYGPTRIGDAEMGRRMSDAELNPLVYVAAAALGLALGFASAALDRSRVLESETQSLRTRTRRSEEHGRWLELRADLARELHDLVGHHVTAMVVQAEAGAVGDDPRDALAQIGDSGRTALAELDSLVLHLRDPSRADEPLTTAQRLTDVTTLANPLEHRGIAVEMDIDSAIDVPPDVELAAYRIVQEALTNVVRHARARHAWVTVEEAGEHLHVRVSDDGTGPPTAPTRGSGLAGIGERVAALHGVWTIGARHGGGTTMDAYLRKSEVSA